MIINYLTDLRNKEKFFPETILDIGANVGNFTRQCKTIWPLANSIMIEGTRECSFALSTIGEKFYIELLGDENGKKVTFYKTKVSDTNTGNSIYKENSVHYNDEKVIKEERRLVKLDSLLENFPRPIDFAKLDTQGSELNILKGGIKTLSTCKYILIEVSLKYYNEGVPLKDEIVNFMSSMGYNNREVVETHVWNSMEKIDDIRMGDIYQQDIMFKKD